MASGMSDYWANLIQNAQFRGDAIVFPATWYVGLVTVAASAAAIGTEVAGGSYTRIPMPADHTTWSNAVSRERSNLIAVTYAAASAPWGTVVGWVLCDAVSAGNHCWFGPLTPPKAIGTADQFQIPIGQMKMRDLVTP